jgi:sn-glycerol 3-phosphate transport system ATP-binding protein
MAAIVLDDVRKVYPGGIEAVKGVSLNIADGELVVLVGPSGCGKSTLLRMVAGLETITTGTVAIGDRVVNKLEPAERDIAMVFQNYALYPHMTVYDNLAYGLKNRGTSKADIVARVKKAADILEIGAFLDRKPRQLSGGQRQRVAMGRALVREPAAFLFDEPLSNLDAKLRVQMRVEIKRLQHNLRTTSIYVTHDQLEAMTLADNLVVLNQGRVEQVGRPLEVYRKPASTFVAAFIGSPGMNLLDSEVAGAEGELFSNGPAGEPTTIGFRPEDVSIGDGQRPANGGLNMAVSVIAVEPVGSESFVHGRVAGNGPEVVLRAPAEVSLSPGEIIWASVPPNRVHIFDRASGNRFEGKGAPVSTEGVPPLRNGN